VGQVRGTSGNDLYVPRALWTETEDGPMRTRGMEFDASFFMESEHRRLARTEGIKQLLTKEHARQLEAKNSFKTTMRDENIRLAQSMTTDGQEIVKEQTILRNAKLKAQQQLRAGLDEQAGHIAQREKEHRLREAQEAEELKLRTVKQLAAEFADHDRRKRAAKVEADEAKQKLEAKRLHDRAQQQRENEEYKNSIRKMLLQDECALNAQQKRLKESQAQQEACCKVWVENTGKPQELKRKMEEARLNQNEDMHLARTDAYYAKREAARERQRLKMIQTLGDQTKSQNKKSDLKQLQKQIERGAVNESTRRALEQDMHRLHAKKAEELELQKSLQGMILEKQQRHSKEGYSPPPAAGTMRAPLTISKALDGDLSQRVDASRLVAKPLAHPEKVPKMDIQRSPGLGGVTGVFTGEGATVSGLAATGGKGLHLMKSAQLATHERQFAASWSEGVGSAAMKAGMQAATRRTAAAALDKSNV